MTTMDDDQSIARPVRLPAPTYTPAIVGLGIVLMAWGAVTTIVVGAAGVALLAVGAAGWIVEMRRER
jgi:hypothetical protein